MRVRVRVPGPRDELGRPRDLDAEGDRFYSTQLSDTVWRQISRRVLSRQFSARRVLSRRARPKPLILFREPLRCALEPLSSPADRRTHGVRFGLSSQQVLQAGATRTRIGRGTRGWSCAGKSTTIKILSGIMRPDGGECVVGGMVPWPNRIKCARRIGVVFGQRTQLWWDLPASLIHSPRILFLDEPTIGLDAEAKIAVHHFIREYNLRR